MTVISQTTNNRDTSLQLIEVPRMKKSFKVGDKVFAKVKGYPPWPAQIIGENGKKYNVEFYGTGETGFSSARACSIVLDNQHNPRLLSIDLLSKI
ncbi:hypothetical protein NQ317_007397 [Molorchus minor]|uniref:PWWP domain-containing protein n=1 Tax=Molorchus minor TaxID=1323400 RepID=A0ABQ9JU33_9CUCU|nr:hypothetical protein NQ317_007397 [Molorchus minor]